MIEDSVRQETQAPKTEVHHEVPRCLLRLRDKASAHEEFDGEGIQLWLDFEMEAMLWGVDPDVTRKELAALVAASTGRSSGRSTATPTPRTSRGGGGVEASRRWGATGRRGSRSWRGGARGRQPRRTSRGPSRR